MSARKSDKYAKRIKTEPSEKYPQFDRNTTALHYANVSVPKKEILKEDPEDEILEDAEDEVPSSHEELKAAVHAPYAFPKGYIERIFGKA